MTKILTGDALAVLRKLPDASVHCCVTSPPYWGLRDYGTAKWKGGSAECDHRSGMARGDTDRETPGGRGGSFRGGEIQFRNLCGKCGARRVDSQLGLEATPALYVARMVEVFREVRRVLCDDGTLWLNLGDSYATGGGKVGNCPGGGAQGAKWAGRAMNTKDPKWANALGPISQPNRMPLPGLKPKDLCGIPWRVAFALQADGWYLRSDIIWAKPNPMPESVTDRPTKSHEYLFLLAKNERYYYDADAIKEACQADTSARYARGRSDTHKWADGGPGAQTIARTLEHMARRSSDSRNKRTVWTVTTKPLKEAHFATFPPKLIEPCILAGAPLGGVVLDPFLGAGTTAMVAEQHGRQCIGIELNAAYVKMARRRLAAAKPAVKTMARAA